MSYDIHAWPILLHKGTAGLQEGRVKLFLLNPLNLVPSDQPVSV